MDSIPLAIQFSIAASLVLKVSELLEPIPVFLERRRDNTLDKLPVHESVQKTAKMYKSWFWSHFRLCYMISTFNPRALRQSHLKD